jgi:basic membrane protein A
VRRRFAIACLTLAWLAAAPADAWAFRAAVLYNVGGKLDKSFNESAFRGVLAARAQKIEVTEYEPAGEADRTPMLEAAASAEIVVAIGFAYRDTLAAAAKNHPDTRFTIIDNVVDLPNVQSVRFKEQEGAFLAGLAAATASATRVVGFVGGMDSALVRRFQAGFEQGVRYAAPEVRVIPWMLGTSVEAFADPMAGYLTANREIADQADVLFAAAGASGLGVYQAAEEAAVLAIGVDSDQNHLFPGTMLTSVVKDVGATLSRVLADAAANRWRNGVLSIGLKEGGLSLAIGRHNAHLIGPDLRAKIDRAAADIAAGVLTVGETPQTPAPVAGGGAL